MSYWQNSIAVIALSFLAGTSFAGVDGSISGNVTDPDGAAAGNLTVQILAPDGHVIKSTTTSQTGDFSVFPIEFGTYLVNVEAPGFQAFRVPLTVASSSVAHIDVHLARAESQGKEYVVNVKAKKNLVQPSSSGSKTDVTQDQIQVLPGGDGTSLPKLLAQTTPGVIQGPFGQMFIRGNHANVQYQIDGVQLPDSMSGTFGDALSVRDIDHMEVITGGIPAEYGERMAAVMNIVTKAGPETPQGAAEIKYGSYNTFNPQASYGGSDASGKLRYYVTANYMQTDRGLDTPQPASSSDQSHGGEDAIHDHATSNDEFLRLDYILDNSNKFTFNIFNSSRAYQIPNFPSSFSPSNPYFSSTYTDQFGNTGSNVWIPATADNNQSEQNSYIEFVWKGTLSEHSFLQIAPYYKRSALIFNSDATADLTSPATQTSAFNMNRSVDNYGIKTDYTLRLNDENLVKSGFQLQQSNGAGTFSLQTSLGTPAAVYGTPDHGAIEAVYLEDAYQFAKVWTLNAGLRYTGTQFNTEGLSSQDGLVQPRVGLEWMATETTKLHIFYGKLFMPAPFEDLREAFAANGGTAAPYDVKAEKDDFYEIGIAQQVGANQLVRLNTYYKDATDMIDDTQLLQTSIAQPYNFAHGFATGVEFSVTGEFAANWSDFFNYAYEDARGEGISGGAFGFGAGQAPPSTYLFLDHVQLNTANAGITYKTDSYWTTLTGLYGSGLRTREDNGGALPAHTTFDFTFGYIFRGESWLSKWKTSLDVTNLMDDPYPITIANGYNGNHYAAGREFFLRLAKEL